MSPHRKLPHSDLIEKCTGQITLLEGRPLYMMLEQSQTLILIVRPFPEQHAIQGRGLLQGDFIASDINWKAHFDFPCLRISDITSYQILTRRELPMYIGMNFTSDLLAELIRGDHE